MQRWWLAAWRLIRFFTRAKKTWRRPRRSQVVIFDACAAESLLEHLGPWRPEVLHLRGEQINVPLFLASLRHGRGFWDAYIDRFLHHVGPRLVATHIDNDIRFFSLSCRHPALKTLLVQNGWKGYFADVLEKLDQVPVEARPRLTVDYMLLFGAVAGSEFARYVSGEILVIGSIRNNSVPVRPIEYPGVMAFVSQWSRDSFYMDGILYTEDSFFRQIERPIVELLARYAARNDRRLVIIPRNPPHSAERRHEEAYYREILGADGDFMESEGPGSSYRVVDAVEVVVAVDTTLAYEAIARGKKTAVFSVRSAVLGVPGLTYGWPGPFADDGPFWTNRPDPLAFERILDRLFAIDDAQWQRDLLDTDFATLMVRDPGNTILTSLLERELAAPQ